MKTLTFASCQAPIADNVCREIVSYLGEQMALPTTIVSGIPWQERSRLLDSGKIDIGWICGAPYVGRVSQSNAQIELLAAPVPAAPRYQQRPNYFSEMMVHANSTYQSFSDLRGSSWAYNEPESHSGFHIVRYHLATIGEQRGFFGRVVESGAHQTSLRMILEREIDSAAIDSTVLDMAFANDPALSARLRSIATLGPSPIPPLVIQRRVSPELREEIRSHLLRMHREPRGRSVLASGQIARFAAVTDNDYDPIRHMLQVAEDVML